MSMTVLKTGHPVRRVDPRNERTVLECIKLSGFGFDPSCERVVVYKEGTSPDLAASCEDFNQTLYDGYVISIVKIPPAKDEIIHRMSQKVSMTKEELLLIDDIMDILEENFGVALNIESISDVRIVQGILKRINTYYNRGTKRIPI